MSAAPALRVEGIVKRFGALRALGGVGFAVAPGERRAVIGPNGAGKTTLFSVISGELAPTAGRVELGGVDVTRGPAERVARHGLARTYQRNNLFLGLSLAENVRLAVRRTRGLGHNPFRRAARLDEANARADALLGSVGLTGASRRASDLSHGEQRQLEIAIALAGEPRVLLLDEPCAGMSPAETADFTRFLHGLPRTITLLIIEHDMDVVFALADRITVLHHGEVLAEGAPEQVRADPAVRRVYLSGGVGAPG